MDPPPPISQDAYDELRAVARYRLLVQGAHSLQATELVHEAWARLERQGRRWNSRKELFGMAARAMRDLLVERARARATAKRGGDWTRVRWESALQVSEDHPAEFLMLDDALSRLSSEEPECARVVELLFFAGFTGDETAAAMGVSPSTIDRRWRMARAWLRDDLERG